MDSALDRLKGGKFPLIGFRHRLVSIDEALIKRVLVEREPDGYKGDYGQVLVIAGSVGFTGAAYLTTQAAVRSGAGLVTLCTPREIQDIMSIKLTEAMTINFEQSEKIGNLMIKASCIAIGPGMGNSKRTLNIVKTMLQNAECPIIIDADGLNSLQEDLGILHEAENKVVLTPHYGEMARLTNLSIEEIKKNKIEVAKKFAREYNVIVLLKDHRTLITDGDEIFENTTGNSAMASGGMGDVLTGIIASFIAQGYEPMEAACLGAYVHGHCGDKLSKEMFCVNATHIVEELPFDIKLLMKNDQ